MRSHIPLALGLAGLAYTAPAPQTLWARQGTSGPGVGACQGDSCKLADLARSSGNPPPTTTASNVAVSNQCILDSLSTLQSQGRLSSNACPTQVLGPCGSSSSPSPTASASSSNPFSGLLSIFGLRSVDVEERQTSGCTPYTLIFAKGTFETGDLGSVVGPGLANNLTASGAGLWTVTGIDYDNSVDGYDCLGMPGGIMAYGTIESTVASCPSTKIIVSGYSQGAEVAHNSVAWSRPAARDNVYGVVTFGDPMDGAPIVGLSNSQIRTECDPSDDICQGGSTILPAHLSYGSGPWIPDAVTWIKQQVGQTS